MNQTAQLFFEIGEPLAQAKFCASLLRICRENGLHTCVETCGYGSWEALLQLKEYTDLFLFDWKLSDDGLHRQHTGVSNLPIARNLELLCRSGAQVMLRCPMIPDVNLNAAHLDGILALAARCGAAIREVHLEPYHPLGVDKALSLGRAAAHGRTEFLEKSTLAESQQYLQQRLSVPVKIL